VTLAEMENAAIGLGLGVDKAHNIFNKWEESCRNKASFESGLVMLNCRLSST
jgi:hypothetical protein